MTTRKQHAAAGAKNEKSRPFSLWDYTDCATTRGGGVHAIKNESMHTPQLEQGQGVGQAVQSGKAAGSRWIDASGFAFNQGQHANNYQGRWEEGDQPENRHKGRQKERVGARTSVI